MPSTSNISSSLPRCGAANNLAETAVRLPRLVDDRCSPGGTSTIKAADDWGHSVQRPDALNPYGKTRVRTRAPAMRSPRKIAADKNKLLVKGTFSISSRAPAPSGLWAPSAPINVQCVPTYLAGSLSMPLPRQPMLTSALVQEPVGGREEVQAGCLLSKGYAHVRHACAADLERPRTTRFDAARSPPCCAGVG